MLPIRRRTIHWLLGLAALALVTTQAADLTNRWWKGNLHTHSLWSDGNEFPEMIVRWYHEREYDFLALSDHNVLSEGERWMEAPGKRVPPHVLEAYEKEYGDWIERREEGGKQFVRLKPLGEFRHLFEAPGRFLLIQSEEISDKFEKRPIHLNATNLRNLIPPQGGTSVVDVLQRDVRAVLDQRRETGQLMFPHINHPNFGWALTIEDMLPIIEEQFFEVYNGHPAVHNEGDALHSGTERMWDVLLAHRISDGAPPIYGIAVDDGHDYHNFAPNRSNPGRGWVMVEARRLTPEGIVRGMEAGRFYASTGVVLDHVEVENGELKIRIRGESGVTYKTRFFGTLKGFDRASEPMKNEQGAGLPVSRKYSEEIGKLLGEVEGLEPAYRFQGNELYVRAKILSSKTKEYPLYDGEPELAWTQPKSP